MGTITPRRLVQRGNDMLVICAQGFLIAFRDRTIDEVVRRLKNFDFEEWYWTLHETSIPELTGICHPLMNDAQSLLEKMSLETRRYLHEEILQLAGTSLLLYNRLLSTNDFHTTARLQAIRALPMLLWELTRMDYPTDQLRKRIDSGQSVWEAYQAYYPCKVALLKRIANASNIPEEWHGKLPVLLAALENVALEKLPQTAQDWQAFTAIHQGMRLSTESYEHRRTVKMRWMGEIAKTGWQKFYAKFQALDTTVWALGDTFDFLDELAHAGNWLVRNVRQCRKNDGLSDRDRYIQHWMRAPDTLGLNRLLEASIRWHQIVNAQYLSSIANKKPIRWKPLFNFPAELSNTVVAVTLQTQYELCQESEQLMHCVRSYAEWCYLGETHIVSLRNHKGESLSTVEIMRVATEWQIVQHRVQRNGEPEPYLKELEKPLLKYVEQHADNNALQNWKKIAAMNNPFTHEVPEFSLMNLRHVCSALGRERMLGLFVDVTVIRESVKSYQQSAKRA
jgi:hypothetical protein